MSVPESNGDVTARFRSIGQSFDCYFNPRNLFARFGSANTHDLLAGMGRRHSLAFFTSQSQYDHCASTWVRQYKMEPAG